jgi:DNA-binding PadR family transcriptional regulator
VVGLVDDLEAAGLVERRAEAGDRRVRVIHLTERGARAVADLSRVSAEHETDLTATLSAEERRHLLELLERIADPAGGTPGSRRSAPARPAGRAGSRPRSPSRRRSR